MLKVLLIDDDPLTVMGLKSYIDWQDHGFIVAGEALDGLSGLKISRRLKPDLVVIDIKMPGMSGIELISHLKNELPETDVIILSAYGEFEMAQKAIRLGVKDYLLKPIRKRHFVELIKRIAVKKTKKLLEGSRSDVHSKVVRDTIEYIHNHVDRDISLQEIADTLSHNECYISHIFSKEMGTNFLTYVTLTKMQRAKELLEHSHMKINVIAGMVGYHNPRYFSQVFRKYEGCTPSQYRERRLDRIGDEHIIPLEHSK